MRDSRSRLAYSKSARAVALLAVFAGLLLAPAILIAEPQDEEREMLGPRPR